MPNSIMATNLLRRNYGMALSSASSRSRSGNASPNSRHSSISGFCIHTEEDSSAFFGEALTCESPPDSMECDPGLLLRRMPRKRSADHGFHYNPSESLLVRALSSDSGFISPSQSVSSLNSSYTSFEHIDLVYDRIVDALIAMKPNPFLSSGPRNLFMFNPIQHDHLKNESVPPLMIKRVRRGSPESLLLLAINQPHLRLDPWNAAPYILATVERGEYVYLCMKQLAEYNKPPLLTVEHYVDFFRQVLERLSFLHEYDISGLSLANPSSYMMDTSSGPGTPANEASSASPPRQFNRFKYPVQYYLVNTSKATRIARKPTYPASTPASPGREHLLCPFQQDVRDCGIMFESLLANVPQIADTFTPLIERMKMGHFTHEFFENLRDSLDKDTFGSAAVDVVFSPSSSTPSDEFEEDEAYSTTGLPTSPPPTARAWEQQFFPIERCVSH